MAHMELKKKRMLTYFIKSAQDIMTAEGMQGITLRKVADGAGYNNATLYNYFDDLDHVVLYACLKLRCKRAKKVSYRKRTLLCYVADFLSDFFRTS